MLREKKGIKLVKLLNLLNNLQNTFQPYFFCTFGPSIVIFMKCFILEPFLLFIVFLFT